MSNPYQSPVMAAQVGSPMVASELGGRVVLQRVGVLSLGKMFAVMYVIIGLLVGGVFALAALAGANAENLGPMAGMGIAAVIIMPLMYGVLGFIGGIILALIYNVVASVAGGVEMDLGPVRR